MRGSFSWKSNSLGAGLRQFETAIDRNMHLISGRITSEMQTWARDEANHPWANRTGNAERGLHTWNEQESGVHTIYLSHGVDYGLELETRAGGKWGVIQPAIDVFSARFHNYARALFAGMNLRR